MYRVSSAFHEACRASTVAVAALLRFADGTIFTTEDFTTGFTVKESVISKDALTIGETNARSFGAEIVNDAGLLSSYDFGTFAAYAGVQVGSGSCAAGVCAILRSGEGAQELTGHDEAPYLRLGGAGISVQPDFAVKGIYVIDDTIYAVGATSEQIYALKYNRGLSHGEMGRLTHQQLAQYTHGQLMGVRRATVGFTPFIWGNKTWAEIINARVVEFFETEQPTLSAFMRAKIFGAVGRGINYDGETLIECKGGKYAQYEFCKLGTFYGKNPKRRRVQHIKLDALDAMQKFDTDVTELWNNFVYPVTIGYIFEALCHYVGLEYETSTFINSTREFTSAPFVADTLSGRELLSWIAQAACAWATITRDNKVRLGWFAAQGVAYTKSDYFGSLDVAEYTVKRIDKLQVRAVINDVGVVIPAEGETTNAYIIEDCPLLYGTTDAEIRGYATPIYDRLAAFTEFSPLSVGAVCDYSIEAGDVITVDGYALPIFYQSMAFGGKAAYESGGDEYREQSNAYNTKIYKQDRSMRRVVNTIDEWSSTMVRSDNIMSVINQTPEGFYIMGNKIALEGCVTINDGVKFLADGSMEFMLGKCGGWTIDSAGLYHEDTGAAGAGVFFKYPGVNLNMSGFGSLSDVVLKIGARFSVTYDGDLYANGAHISGDITASGLAAGSVIGDNATFTNMSASGKIAFQSNNTDVLVVGNRNITPATYGVAISFAVGGALNYHIYVNGSGQLVYSANGTETILA